MDMMRHGWSVRRFQWRQRQERDVVGHGDVAGEVPAGVVEQQHGMLAGADRVADLGQVQVHRRGVAQGQDQGRALAFARADGAEDGAGRLAIAKSLRPLGVETQNPVAHDLQGHVAKPRCLRARAAVVDRRQGQQTTGLGGVLAAPRKTQKLDAGKIRTQGDGARHGEPPMLTRVNHISPASGNPSRESRHAGGGIRVPSTAIKPLVRQ
jgi:hypothetical protein